MKILILSVGGHPGPGTLSISHHKPEVVVFFASPKSDAETIPHYFPIIQELRQQGYRVEQRKAVLTDDDQINRFDACYAKAREALDIAFGYENATVIVDITGGSKPMSAGLGLAAAERDVQFTYVGGKRSYDTLDWRVMDEMKVLDDLRNPLHQFHTRELERLAQAWNNYRIEEALSSVEQILQRDPPPYLKAFYSSLHGILQRFYDWDRYAYADGDGDSVTRFESFDSTLQALKIVLSGRPEMETWQSWLLEVQKSLTRLKTLHDLAHQGDHLEIVIDILSNAERRAAQMRFDDAYTRLMGALEMWLRLRVSKLLRSKNIAFNFDGFLEERHLPINPPENVKRWAGGRRRFEDLQVIVGVLAAWNTEHAQVFRDHYLDGKNGERLLRDFIGKRNRFVHDAAPLTEQDYLSFRDFLDNHLNLRASKPWPRLEGKLV